MLCMKKLNSKMKLLFMMILIFATRMELSQKKRKQNSSSNGSVKMIMRTIRRIKAMLSM